MIGLLQDHYIFSLTVALGVCLLGGVLLMQSKSQRELGIALFSGAVLALVSLLAQLGFQERSDRNDASIRASAFRDSIAMTHDLQGFDPGAHSLKGMTMSGKDMSSANLSGADMREANLASSNLSDATVRGAHLDNANLFHVRFDGADLGSADLQGSNLRGAKFIRASLSGADLRGASADLGTCWPEGLEGLLAEASLKPSGVDSNHNRMTRTIGHVCDSGDETDGKLPGQRIRICVDGDTVLVDPSVANEVAHPDTCEKRAK